MDHNKACLKFLIRNYYFSLDDLFIVSSAHNWWERGKSFQRQASFSLFLLSYLIKKFFFEDLQLSSFLCQRTASPLTDCSSITELITSHSIFAVRFSLCLPTSVKKKVVQNPKELFPKYVLIRSTQKNTCWRDDQGESVSSLGTLWHHWTLPPLQLNCIVRIFARKRHDDKSFLTKELLLLGMNVLEVLLAGCFCF